MSAAEIATLIVSVISITVAFLALWLSRGSYKTALGQSEIDLLLMITASEVRVEELNIQIAKKEIDDNDVVSRSLKTRIQHMLNAYETACGLYIDKKIDKKRFKRLYHEPIRNLLKNDDLKEYFAAPDSSYKAILKVHNEWYDLEK